MKPTHTGLIGFGFSGSTFHAPIIKTVDTLQISKVLSSRPDKVKQHLPAANVCENIDEIMRDPKIELVIITSPNQTHYPYARKALEARKHVVVEKPFVLTTRQADDLIRLARETNRFVSVYQNRRFDSDFLTLQECMRQGILGKIHTYEAHFDRYRPQVRDRWREWDLPGSGLLYDLGSHLIDQALFLFGKPKTVYADLLKQRPHAKAIDYFHLVLGYESGLRVILEAGCLVKSPGPRLMVHGSRGTFMKYGLDPQEEQLKQGLTPLSHGWGKETPDQYAKVWFEKESLEFESTIPSLAGCYEKYYQQIAEAIRTGGKPPVTAEEARETIRVIEAAIQSDQERRLIDL
ncbi:oxidoreductase [Thermoactinomyces mirandus]|uniref:Oxidoreductase n=1 Tax=Thermoactinomyces mirandus TaxID=2756294 RepID=A0A7W2ARA0_9BACL|nr:oxidoreductase [Thermoactinomyces mirandus]MBA4601355.1 oxidoreductase [Thermoactinomyces mirandus]